MAGIVFRIREIWARVQDEFDRTGPLEGSTTTIGGQVWAKLGDTTTTAATTGESAKATGGTGNNFYTLPTAGPNFEIAFMLNSVRGGFGPVAQVVFRVNTETQERYAVLLRTGSSAPEYVIAHHDGVNLDYTRLYSTGIAPNAGDKVRVTVKDNVLALWLNGEKLGQATMTVGEQFQNTGLMLNGADLDTAFGNFAVYDS